MSASFPQWIIQEFTSSGLSKTAWSRVVLDTLDPAWGSRYSSQLRALFAASADDDRAAYAYFLCTGTIRHPENDISDRDYKFNDLSGFWKNHD